MASSRPPRLSLDVRSCRSPFSARTFRTRVYRRLRTFIYARLSARSQHLAAPVNNGQRPGELKVIPELDGVRGIAVLLVMLCHAYIIQPIPLPQGLKSLYFSDVLYLGWSGVDLFFVLSGFLITGILLDTRDSRNYFFSFYARRVLRIIPLYVMAVFGYFHFVLPIAHHFGLFMALDNSLEPWFWLHLSNWRLAFGGEGHWLGHFWSLAIEEQFYLFWPLVVFISGRRRLPYVCVVLGAMSFGLRSIYAHHNFGGFFLYGLTPFRIEPLAVGSLAATLVRNKRMVALLKGSRFLLGTAASGVLILCAAVSA